MSWTLLNYVSLAAPFHTTKKEVYNKYLWYIFLPSGPAAYTGISDMEVIVQIIRKNPKIGFLYLSPAVPKSSVNYHYYNLK